LVGRQLAEPKADTPAGGGADSTTTAQTWALLSVAAADNGLAAATREATETAGTRPTVRPR
jgi:hypothetical protein